MYACLFVCVYIVCVYIYVCVKIVWGHDPPQSWKPSAFLEGVFHAEWSDLAGACSMGLYFASGATGYMTHVLRCFEVVERKVQRPVPG